MLWLVFVVALAAGAPQDADPDVLACKAMASPFVDCRKVLGRPDIDAEHKARAWHNIGLAYERSNDFQNALAAYDEALRLNPHYEHALERRAMVNQDLGRDADAIADYTSALKLNPCSACASASRGHLYLVQGDYALAFIDYDNAVKSSGGKAEFLRYRADAYLFTGQVKPARTDLEIAVRKEPDNADGWALLGQALARLKDPKALEAYDKALALAPNAGWLVDRSVLRANGGNLEGAMTDIDTALLSIDPPGRAQSLYDRAGYEMQLGRRVDALKDINASLALARSAEAVAQRGMILADGGKAAEAIKDFSSALTLQKDYGYAFAGRGLAYRAVGDMAKAKADCREALNLAPSPTSPFVSPFPLTPSLLSKVYGRCTAIVGDGVSS